jgi:putative redox protein
MVKCSSTLEKYQCEIKSGNYTIVADATKDKGGTGNGFRPHEILEASLAACMNMSVRMTADKLGIPVDKLSVSVELERKANETKFIYSIDAGDDIQEEQYNQLVSLLNKCPVKNTLSKPITFEYKKD